MASTAEIPARRGCEQRAYNYGLAAFYAFKLEECSGNVIFSSKKPCQIGVINRDVSDPERSDAALRF